MRFFKTMSLEQILKEIKEVSGKVTTLSEDVERLKEKDKAREEEGRLEGPRSRSRSPRRDERHRSWSRSRSPRHLRSEPRRRDSPEPRRHWADSDPDGKMVYPPIPWLPSDKEEGGGLARDSQAVDRSLHTECV